MAVHAGLSIKNMVTLSNCTGRPCSQCPLRADEYKRLNFFLPICSMSSSSHIPICSMSSPSHLFSFVPCHHNLTYSHLLHVIIISLILICFMYSGAFVCAAIAAKFLSTCSTTTLSTIMLSFSRPNQLPPTECQVLYYFHMGGWGLS